MAGRWVTPKSEAGAGQSFADLPDVGEEQAALRRVAAITSAGAPPEAIFAAITAEGSALLGGVLLSLARYERGGTEQVIVAQTGGHVRVGAWFPASGPDGIVARMWSSGLPQRTDDFTAIGLPEVITGGVRACVAVPVFVDGALWGSVAAASRTGPLPAVAEDRLSTFADIVAAAVVSAAARTSLRVLADEQAALLRVAALVARGAAESAIFEAVAVEAASLIEDEPTTLVRYEGTRTFTVLATRNGPAAPGTRFTVPVDDAGTSAEMLRTRRPARRDRYDALAHLSYANKDFACGSSVTVPIFMQGRLWGALGVLNEGRRFPAETEQRLVKFAELVGSALANVQARSELQRFGDEQAALRRVAELAASDIPPKTVLRAIVVEASQLFDQALVSLVQKEQSAGWRKVESASWPSGDSSLPTTAPVEDAIARKLLATELPASIPDAKTSATDSPDDPGLLQAAGVPVRVDRQMWGALIVTAPLRQLPQGTVDRLTQFAHVAGTAIASARSREMLGNLARDQAALRRVAELIARGAGLDEVFAAVATEASNILGEAAADLFRYDAEGFPILVAQCRSSGTIGMRLPMDPVAIRQSQEAVQLATLAGASYARLEGKHEFLAIIAAPITVEGQVWGGLATKASEGALSPNAENRLTEFAELAGAAVANAENKANLQASRARSVVMADQTRQRLQRDVHDGAQQRLVQTVLTLRLALDLAERGEDPVELIKEGLQSAENATVELRDLVHGILPASLSRGGLRDGIESLVAGLTVPIDLDVTALPEQRLPTELEVTGYFIVAEALTNVVKHAAATRTRVMLSADPDILTIEVVDDGRGGADRHGRGLTGLADRVDAMNGTLLLRSDQGSGTTLQVTLPRSGRRRGAPIAT